MRKPRIFFRQFPGNRLTLPLLFNIWEKLELGPTFALHLLETPPVESPLLCRGNIDPRDTIVYSFMTPHVPQVAAEIAPWLALRENQRPLLVAGGPHVSGEQCLAGRIGFDWLFSGEGENLFPRLAEELGARENRKEKKVFTQTGPADFSAHLPVSRCFRFLPPLEIMRGCHWRCRYCQTGGQPARFRSESSIREYLAEMKRRRFQRISFISPSALEFGADNAGNIDSERLETFLSLVHSQRFRFLEYGIFPSEIRPGSSSRDLFRLLRRYVSNRCLTFGAQSAAEDQLQFLQRGHPAASIEESVALANAEGFSVNLDFIFALPKETAEMRQQNLSFIRDLQRRYRVRAQIHHFFPLAGSDFAHCFPSFLDEKERQDLLSLGRSGAATDWWLEGEKQAREFFSWLRECHPEEYDKYR